MPSTALAIYFAALYCIVVLEQTCTANAPYCKCTALLIFRTASPVQGLNLPLGTAPARNCTHASYHPSPAPGPAPALAGLQRSLQSCSPARTGFSSGFLFKVNLTMSWEWLYNWRNPPQINPKQPKYLWHQCKLVRAEWVRCPWLLAETKVTSIV